MYSRNRSTWENLERALQCAASKPFISFCEPRRPDGPGPLPLRPRWRLEGLLALRRHLGRSRDRCRGRLGRARREGLLIMVAKQLGRLSAHMEQDAEIGPEGGGGGREAAQMVWLSGCVAGSRRSRPGLLNGRTCATSLAALAARPAPGGCSSLVGRGNPWDGIAGGPVLAEAASRWSSDHRGSVSATPAGWPRPV